MGPSDSLCWNIDLDLQLYRRVRSRISIELTAFVEVGKGCSIYKIASGMDVGLGGHVVLSGNNIKHIWLFLAVLRLSAVTTLSVVYLQHPVPSLTVSWGGLRCGSLQRFPLEWGICELAKSTEARDYMYRCHYYLQRGLEYYM